MVFYDFLGNEQLKNRLSGMFRQDKASHCYLISGPEGSGKHTLARILSAALQCTGSGDVPCGVCPQCRKVFSGNHPDVITVDDEERKYIPVDQIRSICSDVYIRPNEGKKKIYIFPYAEKLTPPGQPPLGQNTLLKTLEEPPPYAVFLLLIPNAGILLPTIRSRCAELHLSPLPETQLLPALRERCPGHTEAEYRQAAAFRYLGQAIARLEQPVHSALTQEFARAFAERNRLAMLELIVPMEKNTRDRLLSVLQEWEGFLAEALSARCGTGTQDPEILAICNRRTAGEILSAIEALRLAKTYCHANVGTAAICSALAVKL